MHTVKRPGINISFFFSVWSYSLYYLLIGGLIGLLWHCGYSGLFCIARYLHCVSISCQINRTSKVFQIMYMFQYISFILLSNNIQNFCLKLLSISEWIVLLHNFRILLQFASQCQNNLHWHYTSFALTFHISLSLLFVLLIL